MDLFHEYKNKYFHLVFHLLNLAKDGINIDDFVKIVDDEEYDDKVLGKEYKDYQGFILNKYSDDENLNLFIKEDDKVYPKINNKYDTLLRVRFSNVEKKWLNDLLNQPLAKGLLGNEIVDKLQCNINDGEINNSEIIDISNKTIRNTTPNYEIINEYFWEIVYAIKNNYVINYTNVDRIGNIHKNQTALPIRIEYSLKDDKLRLSCYSINESRIIMLVLENLEKVEVKKEIYPPVTRKQALELLKDKHYVDEPIILELINKKSAMERFFMTFSSYERNSKYLGNNKYEIKLYYYSFQEEEVIRKIISLGSYVIVKSPNYIVKKVVEKIRHVIDLNKDEK